MQNQAGLSISSQNSSKACGLLLLFSMSGGGGVMRVMLADDDEEDRDFFREVLEEVAPDVKLELFSGGEALMQALHSENELPDLVFLDLNMPVKNGHECLDEIRESKKLKHIPVIIYSTSSSKTQIDATYLGGADLYIPKPERYTDLKAIISEVLAQNWKTHVQPPRHQFVLSRSINK